MFNFLRKENREIVKKLRKIYHQIVSLERELGYGEATEKDEDMKKKLGSYQLEFSDLSKILVHNLIFNAK